MKKVMALVVSILLLCGTTIAYADVDLSNMTQDELLSLRFSIDELIGYPVQGTYITGVDIKEGYYTLTATADQSTYVKLYPDPEAAKRGKVEDLLDIFLLQEGKSTTVHLTESNVLWIQSGALLIPLPDPSWKP